MGVDNLWISALDMALRIYEAVSCEMVGMQRPAESVVHSVVHGLLLCLELFSFIHFGEFRGSNQRSKYWESFYNKKGGQKPFRFLTVLHYYG